MKITKSFRSNLLLQIDSSSNLHAILRSTYDPTNSPNADPRSTHDLRQTAPDALESTRDPTINLALIPIVVCAGTTTTLEESAHLAET